MVCSPANENAIPSIMKRIAGSGKIHSRMAAGE
jgi:hypothetical protein